MFKSHNLSAIFRILHNKVQLTLKGWKPRHTLITILLLGLVQGIVYMAIIPPWWHYDEPGHFEYAWLIANRSLWPRPRQYDPSMRLEMAKSMAAYGWYSVRNYHPDFTNGKTIYIGVPQTGGQPGYYWAASLPLWFLKGSNITVQYYAVRSLSIVFFLLFVYLVWAILAEILPSGHPLQWMVPLFIAFLPGFVDVMISVNDDVGAVLVYSFFLWSCIRLIRRGRSLINFLLVGIALFACFITKNTTWIAFLIVPFVLLSVYAANFTRWWVSLILILTILAGLAASSFNQPAGWYQTPVTLAPLRVENAQAPLGKYVMRLEPADGLVAQMLDPSQFASLRGTTVTVGAWMWSNRETTALLPFLTLFGAGGPRQVESVKQTSSSLIHLTTQPVFYISYLTIPTNVYRAMIVLKTPKGLANNVQIYYDGLTLVKGTHSNTPPQLDPSTGKEIWDRQQLTNLIRNGSVETAWMGLKPGIDQTIDKFIPYFYRPSSSIIYSIQDTQGSGWYYWDTTQKLFQTFWDQLAGMKATLPWSNYSYSLLAIVTLLAALGFLISAWHHWRKAHIGILVLFGLSLFLPWAMTLLRGSASLTSGLFIPLARYAFPAIIPTSIALCAGWLETARVFNRRLKVPLSILMIIFINLLIILDSTALFGALQYFHPTLRNNIFTFAFILVQLAIISLFFWGHKWISGFQKRP